MTWAYVLITALGCLLLGIALCVAGFFCWYMLKMIRELKASVDIMAGATHELIGEGSFTRISKSLSALSGAMPDMLSGIKEFANVMRLVFKSQTAPDEETGAAPAGIRGGPPRPRDDGQSAFFGYSEQQAAINEVQAEAARQKIVFTHDEAARSHTDEAT